MIKISRKHWEEDLEKIRALLLQYYESRDFDHALEDYKKELEERPGAFGPPEGRLLLAHYHDQPAGCVAFRKIGNAICEMKRLYVPDEFRGKGIGSCLVTCIIEEAIEAGYKIMRLDTHPSMIEAEGLYSSFGFKEIEPYRSNPVEGVKFFELDLM